MIRRRRRGILIAVAVLSLLPAAGLVADLTTPPDPVPDLARSLASTQAPPDTARLTLCVDGPEFWAALERDLANATDRVLVQTLSFEADPAGLALASALVASPAAEKVLVVDAFSRYVVSDKFVLDPTRLLDVELGREVSRTVRLLEHLEAHGVTVVTGRPYGPGQDNLAARDHKKIVVVDDAAYVGGINFSEHNFLWHDLMVRIADPLAADALAADVLRARDGASAVARASCEGVELVMAAGDGRTDVLDRIAAVIEGAEESIYLECPYVTEPYFELLGEARRRGVAVTIVTSERNNRLCMKQSIMDACTEHDMELRLLPGRMTHVKALLADDRTLLMGSANFDFLSATLQPEVVAVITDPSLVADFRGRVAGPALETAWLWPNERTNQVVGDVSAGVMKLAGSVLEAVHDRGNATP